MKSRAFRRKAFALTTAIVLLGLVGTAVLTLTAALSSDVKRTGRQRSDAQLRQLLLTGAEVARERIESGGLNAGATDAELPKEIVDWGGKLRVNVVEVKTEDVSVTIEARLADRSAIQAIDFKKESGAWRGVSAKLNP